MKPKPKKFIPRGCSPFPIQVPPVRRDKLTFKGVIGFPC